MTKSRLIDRERWISSRTDNPDNLGRIFWNAIYDILTEKEIPIDIEKEMIREFLDKKGLFCNLDDPNQFSMAQIFFWVPIELSKDSMQNTFNAIVKLKSFIGNKRIP